MCSSIAQGVEENAVHLVPPLHHPDPETVGYCTYSAFSSNSILLVLISTLISMVIKTMGREWPVLGSPSSLVTERDVVLGCPLPSPQVSTTIEYLQDMVS